MAKAEMTVVLADLPEVKALIERERALADKLYEALLDVVAYANSIGQTPEVFYVAATDAYEEARRGR